jgi:PPK2 family polyphosphate:nucleotide phosphotransferase
MKEISIDSPYLVPFDKSFTLKKLSTRPPKNAPAKDKRQKTLEGNVEKLAELQERLYADDRYSLLAIFQAMDAAGKDSTIDKVFSGVNPAGFQVFSFKQPSHLELDHDFLWRSATRLPERGRIGIFNRSYYEEVLVVKVHPEYLKSQKLPVDKADASFWEERYESIRSHERHLAANGTIVIKFFLHVSKDEQRERFLARLDRPEKNWKFAVGDVEERAHWDEYQAAYEMALKETSRPWAPWYAIPADSKSYMRMCVSEIVIATCEKLALAYPELGKAELEKIQSMRGLLDS